MNTKEKGWRVWEKKEEIMKKRVEQIGRKRERPIKNRKRLKRGKIEMKGRIKEREGERVRRNITNKTRVKERKRVWEIMKEKG